MFMFIAYLKYNIGKYLMLLGLNCEGYKIYRCYEQKMYYCVFEIRLLHHTLQNKLYKQYYFTNICNGLRPLSRKRLKNNDAILT